MAPGVDIMSLWIDEGYATASGTSQAVPFVTASLALILEEKPGFKRVSASLVEDIKDEMMRSSDILPRQETPHDDRYGYGLIQADSLGNGL